MLNMGGPGAGASTGVFALVSGAFALVSGVFALVSGASV
jgi:hypothetical protein